MAEGAPESLERENTKRQTPREEQPEEQEKRPKDMKKAETPDQEGRTAEGGKGQTKMPARTPARRSTLSSISILHERPNNAGAVSARVRVASSKPGSAPQPGRQDCRTWALAHLLRGQAFSMSKAAELLNGHMPIPSARHNRC